MMGALTAVLGGLILTGLLCAGYGLLLGYLRPLYERGRGPFF